MSINPYLVEEQGLRDLEMSWDDALARCDATAFHGLMADDYQVTGINGEISDKSKVLEAIESVDPQMRPHRRDTLQVRIYGDTAVITGRITWKGSGDGAVCPGGNCQARYLKVYVRRPDGWKVVVAQATRIANHGLK